LPQPQQPQQPQPQPQPETQPAQPTQPQPDTSATSDALAQAPTAGSDAGETFNPQMIGDLVAGFFRTAQVPNGFVTTTIRVPTPVVVTRGQPPNTVFTNFVPITVSTPVTRTIRFPVLGPGAFKVSENESPQPLDRVFLTYNYYNNVGTADSPRFDVHREVFGFEKTFLDGTASIGMRLPYLQQPGSEVGQADVGDLSVLLKFAFLNDRETGNVLSGGLAVTAPTAGSRLSNFGNTRDTLLQPFGSFIFNIDRLYLHGFSSVIVPTETSDPTLMSNDVGVGYRLIRNADEAMFRYVIPTIEGHLTTALSKRGLDHTPVGFPDTFVLTAGVHLGVFDGGLLTFAVGAPFTGPRTFDVEGIVQFNYRF
jgi:hypothetical protein